MVAPNATHADTTCVCDSRSYRRRAWCRAEIMSCWARNGALDMYYSTNEGLRPLAMDDAGLVEALDVFAGDLTCCRLGHANSEPCDREALMHLPVSSCTTRVEEASPKASTRVEEHCRS